MHINRAISLSVQENWLPIKISLHIKLYVINSNCKYVWKFASFAD
jgi:hypothetical protein